MTKPTLRQRLEASDEFVVVTEVVPPRGLAPDGRRAEPGGGPGPRRRSALAPYPSPTMPAATPMDSPVPCPRLLARART